MSSKLENVRVRLDSAYFDLLIPSTALVCLPGKDAAPVLNANSAPAWT